MDWPAPVTLTSARLRLDPLGAEHASEMVDVLADPSIYEYIGGAPPSDEQLRRRFTVQARGHSEDGSQGWFNWIVRLRDSGAPAGFVQATVSRGEHGLEANIAWVITPIHQGCHLASEATGAMISWLKSVGVDRYVAFIHPEHRASMGVARHQGLQETAFVDDGEARWES